MENRLTAVSDADIQHRAFFHRILPFWNFPQKFNLTGLQLRNKSHCADVDPKDWEIMLCRDFGRV